MKDLLLYLACCFVLNLPAQTPANDDCATPIDLGIAPVCTPDLYTNAAATASDIGVNNQPTCFSGNSPGHDVWFSFTCPVSPLHFRLALTGAGADPITNPQMAVYEGPCSNLVQLACGNAGAGQTALFLDVLGLTPGKQYFIRVSDFSPVGNGNAGTFNLCINEIPPTLTIDQGGSTLCEGMLFDSGGPDGDYGPNEDHVFTICPATPAACIDFTLEYFSLDAGPVNNPNLPGFDLLSFYDGPDLNAPLLAQINSFSTPYGADGGGGVCFRVQASSGCLTLNFQSDATVQFEGFKGHWACSNTPCIPHDPIEIDTAVLPQDMVNAILAPGTSVSITNIDCAYGAYGTFSFASDNNDLGLSKGLVLSTGSVNLIPGPNKDDSATRGNMVDGDKDLDYLSQLQGTNSPSIDACVIELDVFVATDELAFEYVFGSEEYPEFVGDVYNDIFAFLASGPGITGDPNLGGARNIAVLPGTTVPVQINSVNNLSYWEYFRNNGVWENSTLEYDGLTSDFLGVKKSLTARVNVLPCKTYHLKLAIADRFDDAYDSGVFIADVRGGTPTLSTDFANGLDYLLENCSGDQDQIVIRLAQPKSTAVSYTVAVGGSATPGTDYLLNIPPLVTFQPGDTVLTFPIQLVPDQLTEGTETITLTLSKDFGCGAVVFQTLVINLNDNAAVAINNNADTLYACSGGTILLEATGAQYYFWEPSSAVSDPNIANPTLTPTQDMVLRVTGTVGACSSTDSIQVKILAAPSLNLTTPGAINICQGDTLQLQALTNTGPGNLIWTPKSRLSDPYSLSPLAFPLSTTTYTATLSVPGCPPTKAQLTVGVDTLFFPVIAQDIITTCPGDSVPLATTVVSSTHYQWIPASGLDDPSRSGPLASPDSTTVYTLMATSANGYCSRTGEVTVVVQPVSLNLPGADTIPLCLGDTLTLIATAQPDSSMIQWTPAAWISPAVGPEVVVAPEESLMVIASYTFNGCSALDSVYIRVDSLPDLFITLQPDDKSVYCPGDTVYLLSVTYEPAHFPGMTHRWEAFSGQLTPLQNWNLVVNATTSHLFQRITENHACRDTSEVFLPVGISSSLIVTASPDTICPGETVQITAVADPVQTVAWDNPSGVLSCADCLNPLATPLQTTTFTVTTPEADCPASASVQITVLPLPALDLSPSVICLGDSIRLNNTTTNPADSYAWSVIPPGDAGSLAGPNDPSPTVRPAVTTTYRAVASGQCPNQGEITVSVNSATVSLGEDMTICPGTTVSLSAITTGAPGTITWFPGPGTGNTISVTPGATTTYFAVLNFQPDCTTSDSVTVGVTPALFLDEIQADPKQDTLCEGTPLVLRSAVNLPGVDLMWQENGLPIPGAVQDSLLVSPAGDVEPLFYAYLLTATDAYGCTATAGPYELWVSRCFVFPNAFTPDNDGVNDTFGSLQTFGGALNITDFRIFNRWGQMVFQASPTRQNWDGRIDGKEAPGDVYAYYLVVRFANGEEKTYKGDVTLLR